MLRHKGFLGFKSQKLGPPIYQKKKYLEMQYIRINAHNDVLTIMPTLKCYSAAPMKK